MRIKILGSAAGGGFPQWNCACHNCSGLRRGSVRALPRTQTQIAFSPDAQSWFLAGASPDLRSQLLATPELAPPKDPSSPSPIAGVFLPDTGIDSVLGLLHLREFQTFFVFATQAVQRALQKENRIFRVLDRATPPVKWITLPTTTRLGCHLSENPGDEPAFLCSSVPLGGSFADYISDEIVRTLPPEESVVGLGIQQGKNRFFFAPSLSGQSRSWIPWAEDSDLVLIDGTFWSDDELIHTGRSAKTAREIGHLPLSGADGLLEQYPKHAKGRKILIHINNTNPILDEDSAEHRAVLDAGFEIAYDGMEFEL